MKKNNIPEDRWLENGIYDVTGIPYFFEKEEFNLHHQPSEKAEEFMRDYKDFVIGHAYQCYGSFILAWRPEKAKENPKFHCKGSGFNYGSTNLLENCPASILILAEND